MTATMPLDAADWVRATVLPPLWREEPEDLRTCLCQAPPSDWLGDIAEPEARLWDRDGRNVSQDGALVEIWLADRVCRRRREGLR